MVKSSLNFFNSYKDPKKQAKSPNKQKTWAKKNKFYNKKLSISISHKFTYMRTICPKISC